MSLAKIFGLYTISFLGRDCPHRHSRTALRLVAAVDRLDLHGSLPGHLRRHRHHHSHLKS